MKKLCECGCGQPAPIAPSSNRTRGYVKDQPRRFVKGHYKPMKPADQLAWPYRQLSDVTAPSGTRYEHTLIAQSALGKPLPKGAEIHHADGNPRNNAKSNLVICQDKAYHKLLHVRARTAAAGGNPNTEKVCNDCHIALPFDCFHRSSASKSTGRQTICKMCSRVRFARYYQRRIGTA